MLKKDKRMKYLTDETSILDEYKDWQKNGNHLIFF